MARTRQIKPGFFLNEELASVAPLGRLLFAGLWTIADREGRLEDRPGKLRAAVLPYDRADGEKLIAQLAEKGFLLRYEVGGKHYLQIVNFAQHQHPHPKEQPSEIPAPFESESHGITGTSRVEGEPLPGPAGTSPSLPSLPSLPSQSDPTDQTSHTTRGKRVDEAFIAQMAEEYPDFGVEGVRAELEKCRNRKSWDGFKNHQQAFRNWMANARTFRERDRGNRGSGTANLRGPGPYAGAPGGGGVRAGGPGGGAAPRVAGFDATGIRRIGDSAPAETRAG